MINKKKLFICILIPLVIGAIGAALSGFNFDFSGVIKPSFMPPNFLFPIVWTILYILMGISYYIISESSATKSKKNKAIFSYYAQLILNSLWTLIFFKLKLYLTAFIWILLIIFALLIMFYNFFKISKKAIYINIPYLLWLIFAAVLNLSFYIIN